MSTSLKLPVVALSLATLSHCLDPTEIVLELSTDVSCGDVQANGVTVAVGPPGVDTTAPGAPSFACADDGGLGSLVVVPSGGIDDGVGIRVVLGVDASASTCVAPDFSGCVVARRALRFSPHQPLTLPIDLQSGCVGHPCDPNSTCFAGACVDAGVTCTGGTCNVESDAGAPDAGACQAVAVQLDQNPVVATPYIAKTSSGYAVTWQNANNDLMLAFVNPDGTLGGMPVAVRSALPLTGWGGPIASDGTRVGVTYTLDGTNVYVTVAGGGAALSFTGQPPVAGGGYDVQSASFVTVVPVPASPAGLYSYTETSATNVSAVLGAGDFTVAQSGDTFYAGAATDAGVCEVTPCKIASGCAVPVSVANCDAVRLVAAGDGGVAWATVRSNALSFETFSAAIDSPDALVLLPTSPVHVVWLWNGALSTKSVPGTSGTVSLATPSYPATHLGPGPGFDAVADGFGSTGYAVVYYQADPNGSSIRFVHLCQ
jgi:hypothetical protein